MSEASPPLRESLRAALQVERWVAAVADAAPYESLEALLESAAAEASALTPAEIGEALAAHPRIGERPTGAGASQAFSRREQSSADADDPVLAAELAAGNRDYEARFGRVFLIRAAGRSRVEILAELRRRIVLDEETELGIVGGQLAEIALLRLRATYAGATPPIEDAEPVSAATTGGGA